MLTLKERHRVLEFLHFFSILRILPIKVDLYTWELRAGKNTWWNAWICRLSYAMFLAHTLYKVLSLVYALFFPHGIFLHHIMIHGAMAATAVMVSYNYYALYIKHAEVNAGFVRMTLTGNITSGGKMQNPFHLL